MSDIDIIKRSRGIIDIEYGIRKDGISLADIFD